MGKFVDFFTRIDAEDPKCSIFPFKYIVALFQIISICFLATLSFETTSVLEMIGIGCWIFFLIISFCGCVYEHELIMISHFWGSIIITILIASAYVFSAAYWFFRAPDVALVEKETVVNGTAATVVHANEIRKTFISNLYTAPGQAVSFWIGGFVLIAVHVVYTWMCYELVKAVQQKNSTLGAVRGAAHKVVSDAKDLLEKK